jgi:3-oxoacyl-[acyl-carrier protein] reductase
MANELGCYNITVNNVLPGYTETSRLTSLISTLAEKGNADEEKVRTEMVRSVPMKRFGTASEVAAVAAFLASPAAAYVNGVSIPVDGGRTGSI